MVRGVEDVVYVTKCSGGVIVVNFNSFHNHSYSYVSVAVFASACVLWADDDDDDEGSAVYRIQWFPESCSDGRTTFGVAAPLVAMSASTQVKGGSNII